jgi:hypothetical protein
MKPQIPFRRRLAPILLPVILGSAHQSAASVPMDSVRLDGFWAVETGRFEKFHYFYGDNVLDRRWQMRGLLTCDFVLPPRDNMIIAAGVEASMWYESFRPATALGGGSKTIPLLNWSFYFNRAQASYWWGEGQDTTLKFDVGYFPYKYNPQVRNLGEYLYRSGVYPTYLKTEFDFPMARILAVRGTHSIGPVYSHDLIFNSETDLRPYMDFSLTYIGTLLPSSFFTPSLGAQLSRFLPVDDRLTTPKENTNIREITNAADTSAAAHHDTLYYTFKSVKLMDRLTIDLKKTAAWLTGKITGSEPEFGFFGSEDLKLYYEHALLGLTSYDSSMYTKFNYKNINHRSPVMVGFNVPGFDLVWDMLAVELEYFANPWPDSYEIPMQTGLPQPALNRQYRDYTKDDFKWSVYLKKSFPNGFNFITQLACDHTRHRNVGEVNMDFEEAFSEPKEFWYWMVKFKYAF